MTDEFDTMATWTADAVAALGAEHALPAACRGSGSPAGLEWLVDQLGLGPGARLLDSGAGVGGPAAYVAERYGVRPVLVEPMPGACMASSRLFDLPVAVGDGAALPVAGRGFDAAWSLGVLCTVEDKEQHLREMVRAVRPGGPVGLLVFVRLVDELPDQPEGNHFPTELELERAVSRSGLEIAGSTRLDDLPPSPEDWGQAADRVSAWIEQHHADEEPWRVASAQEQVMGDLLQDGLVVGLLLACRRPQ